MCGRNKIAGPSQDSLLMNRFVLASIFGTKTKGFMFTKQSRNPEDDIPSARHIPLLAPEPVVDVASRDSWWRVARRRRSVISSAG